jgi:hypothetical protein
MRGRCRRTEVTTSTASMAALEQWAADQQAALSTRAALAAAAQMAVLALLQGAGVVVDAEEAAEVEDARRSAAGEAALCGSGRHDRRVGLRPRGRPHGGGEGRQGCVPRGGAGAAHGSGRRHPPSGCEGARAARSTYQGGRGRRRAGFRLRLEPAMYDVSPLRHHRVTAAPPLASPARRAPSDLPPPDAPLPDAPPRQHGKRREGGTAPHLQVPAAPLPAAALPGELRRYVGDKPLLRGGGRGGQELTGSTTMGK